jgi:hypothetical protein
MHRTFVLAIGSRLMQALAVFVSLVWLAACGAAPSPSAAYDSSPAAYRGMAEAEAPGAPMAAPGPAPAPAAQGFAAPSGGAPVAPGARAVFGAPGAPPKAADGTKPKTEGAEAQAQDKPVAPLLIYIGMLAMRIDETAKVPAALDKVIDIAEQLGGYLTSRTDTTVQVRVPSARFREALTTMEKLGEVTRRSVTAEDVSEEFHDLEVRLANLKAVQKRLQEFLAKAQNIQDALLVERELERVGSEIDQIEGRMRFLRSRAAFSLITVEVTARPKAAVVADHADIPPDPRAIDLPIDWLSRVGLASLLNLRTP